LLAALAPTRAGDRRRDRATAAERGDVEKDTLSLAGVMIGKRHMADIDRPRAIVCELGAGLLDAGHEADAAWRVAPGADLQQAQLSHRRQWPPGVEETSRPRLK
jgi:hypothetical protein